MTKFSMGTNHPAKSQAQTLLSKHFSKIRTDQELYRILSEQPALNDLFMKWNPDYQKDFIDRCTGRKGMKVLYDGIFKEIFNPENTPERLSELLSLLMGRRALIQTVLPNDSVRLGAESSLLYTDIIVQLEDGSLCNVEIQKIGYAFPGERCACYSADHLLRQYKRVRGKREGDFHYRDIKQVYTLVFFEKSPEAFHHFPNHYLHKFRQQSDTGLSMELLQEYFFVPLDIYKQTMENKSIDTLLEAWLAFLSFTDPERIEELIIRYPKFKAMYQDIYELCLNTERVMNMYSKELEILDHNTVMYMIDELQEQVDEKKLELAQTHQELNQTVQQLDQATLQLDQTTQQLNQTTQQLDQTTQQLDQATQRLDQTALQLDQTTQRLDQTTLQLDQTTQQLDQTTQQLDQTTQQLDQTTQQLNQATQQLSQKDQEIAALKAQLAAGKQQF